MPDSGSRGVPGVDRLRALLPDERDPEDEPVSALISGRPLVGEKSRVLYRSARTRGLTSAAIEVEGVDITDRQRSERPARAIPFYGTQHARDARVEVWPGGDPDKNEEGDSAGWVRSRSFGTGLSAGKRTTYRGRPVAIYHPGGRHTMHVRVEGLDDEEAEGLAESLGAHARESALGGWKSKRRRGPPEVAVEGPSRLPRRDLEASR
jgi:hypothetical protein